MFNWNDDYSVGIQEIDDQHKHLLSIGQELMGLIKNHSSDDLYDDVVDAIERMRDYTVYHFRAEEQMMIDAGYADFDAHKEEHDDMIGKLGDIDLSELDHNQTEFVMDLMKFLSKWIMNHIIGSDFMYRDALQAHVAQKAK